MQACNNKTIGDWLSDIKNKSLCLPRFQRKQVWSKDNVIQFLKTLVSSYETPVGMFLVLTTNPSNPAFPIRTIDGSDARSAYCDSLLLDGQQRLSALWKALHDEDKKFRYYFRFNEQFEIEGVDWGDKQTRKEKNRNQNPKNQCKERLFPAKLLNPLSNESGLDEWLQGTESEETESIKNLIRETRKIFGFDETEGKVIPYFSLPADTDKKTAIEIYKTINTNSVTLSQYYLAVADMEGEVDESLYNVLEELVESEPLIEKLENKDIGEMFLKISCLLQNLMPTNRNYKKLSFEKIKNSKQSIFEGVKWTVKELKNLKIGDHRQLPSIVPLRVLPALHQSMPPSGQRIADASQMVKKYLWYAFLTDRYDKQANDRLKKDYDDLNSRFKNERKRINKDGIRIFKEHKSPSKTDIINTGWPQAKNRLARGALLVCCQGGARALASDEPLTIDNCEQRDRHHIFPRSRLPRKGEGSGDRVLNCLFIPEEDNNEYGDDLPGDCIKKISKSLDVPSSRAKVEKRLETHLISKELTRDLGKVTQDAIDRGRISLQDAYNKFIVARAKDVEIKIKELLK
ncbi:MAG: DUF262 domain-containing protein [Hyphomicrobiales bacterium]|nr:DUF262 domain-containing protein [Hyphomicrobiales bacterium]